MKTFTIFAACMALFCVVSASAPIEPPTAEEIARFASFASMIRETDSDDHHSFIEDVNVVSNFLGGKKNRLDFVNIFGGDFAGFGKRSFPDVGADQQTAALMKAIDRIMSMKKVTNPLKRNLNSETTRASFIERLMADKFSSFSDNAFDFDFEDVQFIRDLNILGNFVGGTENRFDALNFFKGAGAGSF
ncbi:hypothetical protein PROFUN_10901 [Planoprotostelium fungivorum]|uniref:Uncharacterized protein n=1 Tax=Planoprotostelium fungivorum TaxID=1890364 RepID=A0A2P6NC56_9EUKA|nr:hypothetical protein PROFUN_10901 [Planoprotostelium fungivorum]